MTDDRVRGRQLADAERAACRVLAANERRRYRLPAPRSATPRTVTVPAGVAEVIRRLYGTGNDGVSNSSSIHKLVDRVKWH